MGRYTTRRSSVVRAKPPQPEVDPASTGLIVAGIILVILATVKNSFLWKPNEFWFNAGDFWQTQWDRIVDTLGEDIFTLCFAGNLMNSILYWVVGFCFLYFDLRTKPSLLSKYKNQPGTNEPVDKAKLKKVLGSVLFNQLFIGSPSVYLYTKAMEWRGTPPVREVPSIFCLALTFVVFSLVEEVMFYYIHRLLHSRHLYRHIHKQHHEWTSPIALTAIYCHPFEHFVANMLPPLTSLFIMGSHVVTTWLLFTLIVINTLSDHSGYHLPFFTSSEYHDFHHLKFTQCYGVFGVLDRLHNTDNLFVSSGRPARHKILLGFKPIRELVPLPQDSKF